MDEFKQDAITEMIRAMSAKIREFEDVKITMDVSPVPEFALDNYMQDWTVWVQNGWIDIICPMIYLGDTQSVVAYSEDIKDIINHFVYQYTGIAPVYYGFKVLTNQQQIHALQEISLGTSQLI